MTQKTIAVGAHGWQHPEWRDNYFPEDLPDDWQLDYYSHHFKVVLVPVSEWLQAGEDEIAQWVKDVKEGFHFLFALEEQPCTAGLLEQLTLIRQITTVHFAGIVAKSPLVLTDNRQVEALKTLAPVYLDDTEYTGNEYAACWRKDSMVENAVVGFISADQATSIREIRILVEAFLAQSGQQDELYLIFEGASPSTKMMQDTDVVVQMLS